MNETKDGFVLHTISKLDDEGWHSHYRVDNKRGVEIDYLKREPLQVQVPVTEEAQAECLANYETRIGGETFKGLVGAIARFSLHDLESLFGGMKSELADGTKLDDPKVIQARVMAWTPWQGKGRRSKKVVTASKSEMEGLTAEEKLQYLINQGVVFTD